MEWLIIIILSMTCWWLWADRDNYRDLYYESLCKNSEKDLDKNKTKDFIVEYDDKIPHPFK